LSFTDNWFLFLSPQVQLYTCGLNQLGSLGIGTADLDPHSVLAPITRPAGVDRWMAIAAGSYHAVAINDQGRVFGWGGNQYGASTCHGGREWHHGHGWNHRHCN